MMPGEAPAADVSCAARNGEDGRESDNSRTVDPETSVIRRSGRFDAFDEGPTVDRHERPFVEAMKFVYRHSTALVPASFLWVVLSLPVVTVGPASLGVYATVLSLRETGRVDRGRVVRTVREHLVPATLLGFLPVLFVGIAALYGLSGLATGLVGRLLTAGALYVGLYLAVLLVPTFVSMAGGAEPRTALRESYVWLASAPVTGLRLLLVTVVLFVATVGLSVGVLLLFAGIAGAYHVEVITRAAETEESALRSMSTPPG